MDDKEITDVRELHTMCKKCEQWAGKDHDWSECVDKPCFRFWLASVCLSWELAWENG